MDVLVEVNALGLLYLRLLIYADPSVGIQHVVIHTGEKEETRGFRRDENFLYFTMFACRDGKSE